ncbi:RluA family pseudouridine synthase [Patescibacteria group bacterium]|nr:RluA family pseudouridine synthase [Patescibacteria group bacterium]
MTLENIDIIYENDDFLAINKPAGWTVHRPKEGSFREGDRFITDWLLEKYPDIKNVGDDPGLRPGIVHRLDKDTSGILIVAKNQLSFLYLKGLFQKGEIKKTYLALVYGRMVGSGRIDKPIGIKPGTVKRSTSAKDMKMMKDAVTEYKVVKILQGGKYTLLEVHPKTGKTHQIRVHLASIGHPVVGDPLYGKKNEETTLKRQFLHASGVEFTMKDGSRIKIEADLPYDLEEVLQSLMMSEEPRIDSVEYD